MEAKKRVNFWVIRNGEEFKDALSEKGRKQVRAVASRLLCGLNFLKVFYSGINQTKETVETILEVIGQPFKLTIEEGFGCVWVEKEQLVSETWRKKFVNNEEITVADWLENWPGALLIRGRFLATMLGWARTLVGRFSEKEIEVLVGSDGPAGGLAVIEPKSTKALGPAEVICYIIEYDPLTDEAKLVHSVRLPTV